MPSSQWMDKDALDALVSDLKSYISNVRAVKEVATYSLLPAVGTASTIYVIKDTFVEYYWDDESLKYVPIKPVLDGMVLNGTASK